jgi:hypothetical protein
MTPKREAARRGRPQTHDQQQQEAADIASDEGSGNLIMANTDGRLLLRAFLSERLFRQYLDGPREPDDVFILDVGVVRLEISLHSNPAETSSAVARQAEAIRKTIALATTPAEGAA